MHVETSTWSPTTGWLDALPTPDQRSSLVVLVGDPSIADHADDPIGQVWRVWGDHAIVGCSSAGADRNGLAVTVVRFDRTQVRASHRDAVRSGGVRRAGRMLAADLADPLLRGMFAVGQSTHSPSALLRGLTDVLPHAHIAGAMIDGWTVVDGRAVHGWTTAVGLVGEHVLVGHGAGSGWEPYGPRHLVTSSWGDTIYTVDGGPATNLFRGNHLDGPEELRRRGLARPLCLHDLEDHTVTRSVIAIDDGAGTVRCAGDVAQGGEIQLVHASVDTLVHGAHVAAKQAAFGQERVALVCTSTLRNAVLGRAAGDDVRDVTDVLEPDCHLIGVQTIAELTPTLGLFDGVGSGSITVTTVGELRG